MFLARVKGFYFEPKMNFTSSHHKTEKTQKPPSWDTWRRFRDWQLVLPPSRPSYYHLEIVKNVLIKTSRDQPIAILGCTPELRDLLFRLGFEQIYLFDKSRNMYSRMNSLRSYSNHENFIYGNWMDTIPKYHNFFCAILSDLTSGNVPYDWQPTFYSAIGKALTGDGVFIDKILTHQGPKRRLSELMTKYSELPFNLLYVNHFSCEFLFCSQLLDPNQMVNSTQFYQTLHKIINTGPLKKFLDECPRITPYHTYWYYGKEWKEIAGWYFRYLEEEKIYDEEANSPYSDNLKIIVTRKRS